MSADWVAKALVVAAGIVTLGSSSLAAQHGTTTAQIATPGYCWY